jgi:hypothetical protein
MAAELDHVVAFLLDPVQNHSSDAQVEGADATELGVGL